MSLEESLIRHADTVYYLRMDWKPITRLRSYLPNLLSLEFNITHTKCWD
ncbi:807_t:CDS:1, partial [Rhizophagus irregularis]